MSSRPAKLVSSGVFAEPQFARLGSILADESNGVDFVIPLETLDDRAFEITVHRMTSKGTVLVIQDVTEGRNAQLEINRMARFDSVTELPNRRCFEEQLALALRREGAPGDGLTVMFLDLDDFKQVNDSLGHRTGDKLLVEIASRLNAIIGPSDLVARWGGDEFVILHHHKPALLETSAVAKRIIEEINRAVVIDGSEVIVGASIGSASAPEDGTSPDALLSKADIALYAAKADGRRVWRAFEPAMDSKIQIRRLIELELRAAVASDGIDVHFQPIVAVGTCRIVGFEALARWQSAVLGSISPTEFIPIVEEIGLMEEMGASVLRRPAQPARPGRTESAFRSICPRRSSGTAISSGRSSARSPPPISRRSVSTSRSPNRPCSRIGATRAARFRPCAPRACASHSTISAPVIRA
jgi:diguanylate cyclase (GGDEF)-like protein